jgi:hypothetical protein
MVWKHHGEMLFEKIRHLWTDNIKMSMKEQNGDDMDWILLYEESFYRD